MVISPKARLINFIGNDHSCKILYLSIKRNGSYFCLILCKTIFVSTSTPRAHFWNMLIKWHIRTETQSTSIAWSRSSVSSHHILNHDYRPTLYAAFTLITIRPRLVSWSSSWTNRDYRINSYQIASHLDINRDNRANRGKICGCQKFCHDYHDLRDYRDHRIRSYDIVTNRNKSYLLLFLNCGDRGRPKHRDLLR